MTHFFELLQLHNRPLFIFGCYNLLLAIFFLLMTQFSNTRVRGANAWFKPFKFALSIAIFVWAMGWYTYYLNAPGQVNLYSWAVIVSMGFVVLYIAVQAGRGQLSHYNVSAPIYSFLLLLMTLSAVMVTLWTGYIGILFCTTDFPGLPDYYVLSIRLAMLLFVFFAFQGASMGSRQSYAVGGPEDGPALPVVNWSARYGDLRIAHFVGIHALQVLPVLSWYVFRSVAATAVLGLLYASLAIFTLTRALQGRPLISRKQVEISN